LKRIHIHIEAADLAASIDFYTRLLGAAPAFEAADYASWSIDSPPLNLAVSDRGRGSGVAHLGIEVDDPAGVGTLAAAVADAQTLDEGRTTCCYARSTKRWVQDPDGVDWELFQTEGRIGTWSLDGAAKRDPATPGCCPTD
jgi:lactoylglutathione lyase